VGASLTAASVQSNFRPISLRSSPPDPRLARKQKSKFTSAAFQAFDYYHIVRTLKFCRTLLSVGFLQHCRAPRLPLVRSWNLRNGKRGSHLLLEKKEPSSSFTPSQYIWCTHRKTIMGVRRRPQHTRRRPSNLLIHIKSGEQYVNLLSQTCATRSSAISVTRRRLLQLIGC
jgi:hypothetical protein